MGRGWCVYVGVSVTHIVPLLSCFPPIRPTACRAQTHPWNIRNTADSFERDWFFWWDCRQIKKFNSLNFLFFFLFALFMLDMTLICMHSLLAENLRWVHVRARSCCGPHHTQLWLARNRRSSWVFCDPKEQQLCACVCARVVVCAHVRLFISCYVWKGRGDFLRAPWTTPNEWCCIQAKLGWQ